MAESPKFVALVGFNLGEGGGLSGTQNFTIDRNPNRFPD